MADETPARPGRRWLRAGAVAVAGGAAATAVGLAFERRLVRRSAVTEADVLAAGLSLPAEVTYHSIETDDGGHINAVEIGQGPPIVLLHGVTLSCRTWAPQLRELSEQFRVIAIDQRGHGRSTPGRDGFGVRDTTEPPASLERLGRLARRRGGWRRARPTALERLAADLRQVLAALDVEHAVLVGHSMGGMVSLQALHDMPAEERRRRIAALALVSTSAGPILPFPAWDAVMATTAPLVERSLRAAMSSGRAPSRRATCAGGAPASPSGRRRDRSRCAFSRTCSRRSLRKRCSACWSRSAGSTCRARCRDRPADAGGGRRPRPPDAAPPRRQAGGRHSRRPAGRVGAVRAHADAREAPTSSPVCSRSSATR